MTSKMSVLAREFRAGFIMVLGSVKGQTGCVDYEFKLSNLKNLKLFSIKVKDLFELKSLRKKVTLVLLNLLFLKALSS